MKRPRLPRLRRAERRKKAKDGAKKRAKPRPKLPARIRRRMKKRTAAQKKGTTPGLWFRFATRLRAVGYWTREKAQAAGRALRAAGERIGVAAGAAVDFWQRRSRRSKIQAGAVAGVLVLYAVIKFVPVPGVPCEVSAAKECAPGDQAVAVVPANALLYAHVTLDEDTAQFDRAREAFDELAELRTILAAELATAVPAPSDAGVDLAADLLSWAEQDVSLALLPGPDGTAQPLMIAGVSDRAAAEQFLTEIAGPLPPPQQEGSAELSLYPSGFAASFLEGRLVFGQEAAVRESIKASAGGEAEALEDSDAAAVRDDLPEARFAEVYLSRAGVRQLLAGRIGTATQLETFVDYGATEGMAAALVAREEGLEIELVSRLDEKLTSKSPNFFSTLPRFEPELAGEAGERAIGYVGVGQLGPTLTELFAQAGPRSGGLLASLQGLASRLEQEAGVNPLQDLLPALGGEAALIAEPNDQGAFASLIVEGVDSERASEALAALQRPLVQAIGTGGGAQIPRFEQTDVDGVTVNSVPVSPTVNLSYAVFDGTLVVSTDPAGIEQVRAGRDGLESLDSFEETRNRLPDEVSALVFLNLDELFGQVNRAGFVEDPFFADLDRLFDKASSLGLAVEGEDDLVRSQLFLALD